MSTNPQDQPVKRAERSSQRRLTDAERHAIAAMWAKDGSITRVANHFNVHRNTVSDIVKQVRSIQTTPVESLEQWRSKLDSGSFQAIERSVGDSQDVHKAASTGLSWLKGVGVLAGDNQVNVTVQAMLASIPAEWREEMILTPDTTTSSNDATSKGVILSQSPQVIDNNE